MDNNDDDSPPEARAGTEDTGTPEPPAQAAGVRTGLRELSNSQEMLRFLAVLVLTALGIYGLSLLPDAASLPIVAALAAGYLTGLSLWRRR